MGVRAEGSRSRKTELDEEGVGAGHLGDMTSAEMSTSTQLRDDEARTGARGMRWALDAPKAGWTLGRFLARMPRSVVALFTKTENSRGGQTQGERSLCLTCGAPEGAV